MTALTKYARIEATGLWRPDPKSQRREVVVSIGDATLVITDTADRALTHWSLAAVMRADSQGAEAVYHPDGDPGETLELSADEGEMIAAIEQLRRAISRARPRTGRLRWLGVLLSVALVAGVALVWLPGALRDHTLNVVPQVKRAAIGAALLRRIERLSGPGCAAPEGKLALARLGARLNAGDLAVLPDMAQPSLHLPGRLIVLDRSLVEQFDEPDVAAGYILTEDTLRLGNDPLRDLLNFVGLRETFRLLTTGEIAAPALDTYAEALMTRPRPAAPIGPLLKRFERAALRSTPYAYARDPSGEKTLDLIEADPMAGRATEPLMSDADWLRLQSICGG
ncbi:MAG: hypothetical protein CML55_00145 [Rhodobacteraceae bacterium]|nr:hypothetical protein [Paracoccaceae bacterium]MBO28747.1 hypothetical protein [Paracoccaceae bacterium]